MSSDKSQSPRRDNHGERDPNDSEEARSPLEMKKFINHEELKVYLLGEEKQASAESATQLQPAAEWEAALLAQSAALTRQLEQLNLLIKNSVFKTTQEEINPDKKPRSDQKSAAIPQVTQDEAIDATPTADSAPKGNPLSVFSPSWSPTRGSYNSSPVALSAATSRRPARSLHSPPPSAAATTPPYSEDAPNPLPPPQSTGGNKTAPSSPLHDEPQPLPPLHQPPSMHRPKPAHLRIASVNIARIGRRKAEVQRFLEDYTVDILLVQETFLKCQDRFTLANYSVFRTDRLGGPGGGTLLAVKKSIPSFEIPNPDPTLEATFISVEMQTGPIAIGSVYVRPYRTLTRAQISDAFIAPGIPVVLGGGFNAKHIAWGCRSTCRRGELIQEMSDLIPFNIGQTEEPTHLSNAGRSEVLQLFLLKDITEYSDVRVAHDFSSDHLPVLLDLGQPPHYKTLLMWCQFYRANRRVRALLEDFNSKNHPESDEVGQEAAALSPARQYTDVPPSRQSGDAGRHIQF